MLKKILFAALAVVLCMALTGCGLLDAIKGGSSDVEQDVDWEALLEDLEYDTPPEIEVEAPEVPELDIDEAVGELEYDTPEIEAEAPEVPELEVEDIVEDIAAATKRMGGEGFGYVSVPGNWVLFDDLEAPDTIFQCSDPAGSTIITMMYYPDVDVTAEQAANNVWNTMEEEGVEDITGATVQIGAYEALQVYGYYASEDIYFVAWLFEDETGLLHYVSAEGSMVNVYPIVEQIQSSYSIYS